MLETGRFDPIQSTVGIQDKDAVGQPNFSRHMHTYYTHIYTHTFSWQRKTLYLVGYYIIILHYISTVLSHVLANLYYIPQLMCTNVYSVNYIHRCVYAHVPRPYSVTDIIHFHMQIRMMAPT